MAGIGQFRRNQLINYTSDITYTSNTIETENSIIDFTDQCLYMAGDNVLTPVNSYYLKFKVRQLVEYEQEFSIKLLDDVTMNPNVQKIRTFKVKQGNDSTVFELIFNPSSSHSKLVFELQRIAADFYMQNDDGTNGRKMDIEVLQFSKVINVIDELKKLYEGLDTLKKIGVQGPPGLLMCINGEEIRVGKSGIYELYNEEIKISYIGFIVNNGLFTQNGGKDYFILDFKY